MSDLDDEGAPAHEPPRTRAGRRRRRRAWPFVLSLVVVAVVVSLLVPFGRHQWAESVIRQPSPYTSLAFVDPAGLPTEAVAGQPVMFTFAVGNHESRGLRYRYFLVSSPSKTKEFGGLVGGIFSGGSLAVSAGTTRAVNVSANPGCSGSPCRISVVLVSHAEAVDFNVRVTGLATTAKTAG